MTWPQALAASDPDRRRWPRVAVKLGAMIQVGSPPTYFRAAITNAGEGGMFIATDLPPAVGTGMAIEIERGGRSLLVKGKVAWRVLAPAGAPKPTGFGGEVGEESPEWAALCARLSRGP